MLCYVVTEDSDMAEKKRNYATDVSIHLLYLYCVLCCINVKPTMCG